MALLGWLWLVSPFVLIAVIAHDRDLQKGIANNLALARIAGCVGVLMMFLGAVAVPGALGAAMFVLGTPFVGLLAFIRHDGRDDGGEGEPDVPPPDWDEFERSFRSHVRRRNSQPRRPRSPTAV